ncbi:hypothetical protein [Methylobacterium aquaticum]|uniref:Holliday junction resolvase RuvC n=1 Tax=Methylobacterium aquaticum TaxID=270351 RepID=A0A0C6EWG4_9HYPH|nr:hypothetical protein [Methylobacterium aquaticum]BAQ44371.1 hypothetical protein Maq22A_c04825 [Methylobacterium aquaticum]
MTQLPRILGLDLSVKGTGWALAAPDEDLRFGTHPLPSTGADVGRLLVAFDEWLRLRLGGENVGVVIFEAPILTGGKTHVMTARKLMNLAGHVEFVCSQLGITCREQHISTNKKEFTGNGAADKDAMIAMARAYGWAVTDDNQADACGLWVGGVLKFAPKHAGRLRLGPLGGRRVA